MVNPNEEDYRPNCYVFVGSEKKALCIKLDLMLACFIIDYDEDEVCVLRIVFPSI